jgi:hypothetical protein
MTTRDDWPFYHPLPLDAFANNALAVWRSNLPDKPLGTEFGPPDWAFAEVEPVWGYTVRKCTCYIFLFKQRQGSAIGLVLNADWSQVQLIPGDSVQALAAALSIVTTRPRRTRANGRREV